MNTVFGLPRSTVLKLVSAVFSANDTAGQNGESESHARTAEDAFIDEDARITVFARGVWSRLVEPGDALAGKLINAIGPTRALEMLIGETVSGSFVQSSMTNELHPQSDLSGVEPAQLTAACIKWRQRLNSTLSIADFTTAARLNMQIITPELPGWPQQLGDLEDHSPITLWLRGNTSLLSSRSVALVGSRASTSYGEHVTADLVTRLALDGATIVSGGAYGVDAIAHRATLNAGGNTIAVLAGGVDRLYPSAHESLFERIRESGLLCAELPPGSSPTKWRFLQRNRLIAALSEATIVCEAGHRSGSLNTAGHAAQLGRPIGAVPGPITSASSAGCHRLLRDYCAVCITSAADVAELIGGFEPVRQPPESPVPSDGESDNHRRVLDALSARTAREIPVIAKGSGLADDEVSLALLELELVNLVIRNNTGWRRIKR